ncbi:tungsten ABC transporter substrate-binding protein [Aliiroseovarius zhejiangensis]|uniref:Tungsten ABC transporter substrate-binding protein n=1 Tax=Aliiroseovarius zhejiangensis TaxID=1632025 RepID=A0ABQ3J5K3_9RHOB|nr:substrate-binding domain-containing protein [Aliiroseovarius zhejiangensis]GHF05879.1 tungsten ABC transporter substrate-binding protein [Aliiroseovarius zhejiangensis]
MFRRSFFGMASAGLLALGLTGPANAHDDHIVVQSTTSTQNSGLFDHILPIFTDKTGVEVRVVAVGTGQAIKNAANGDGDVLFVHAKAAEEAFVADGHGVSRSDVMYNDFVIVGPPADPADVAGMSDATAALSRIAAAEAPFASRGDDSGTHKAELRLWAEAGVDVAAASGGWYRETGSGMGATLNTGTGMGAYIMTDRATWISFGNKGDYQIAVEGDEKMFNQYGIILVNPETHPNVKADLGQQFVDWVLSDEGQEAIASYKVDGQQLFFPNAR